MPLWRLRENESSIIIQETSVLNFSLLDIFKSQGKLTYCKYSLFLLSKAQVYILEVCDEHEALVQGWTELPSTAGWKAQSRI